MRTDIKPYDAINTGAYIHLYQRHHQVNISLIHLIHKCNYSPDMSAGQTFPLHKPLIGMVQVGNARIGGLGIELIF